MDTEHIKGNRSNQAVVPDLIEVGVPADNIVTVPCGVNYSQPNQFGFDSQKTKKSLGIPNDFSPTEP
jgi:hypothetical protein